MCSEVTDMLNEERVKHMVKLASHESGRGAEEMKVSSYFRKDYVGMNMIFTFLWVTIGYVILAGLLAITYMDVLMNEFGLLELAILLAAAVAIYLALVVGYCIYARSYYKKKHLTARKNTMRYKKQLERLTHMYEREEV